MSIGSILVMLLIGLAAGALARLFVPGPDPMGLLGTMLLGIAGSYAGGFLASLIFEGDLELRASSFLGSVVGGVVVLLVYRAVRR